MRSIKTIRELIVAIIIFISTILYAGDRFVRAPFKCMTAEGTMFYLIGVFVVSVFIFLVLVYLFGMLDTKRE